MSSILKYAALMLLVVIIITCGVLYYEYNIKDIMKNSTAEKSISVKKESEQYNVASSFNGDRSQMIDLLKGNSVLSLVYSGSSRFTAKLLYADGTLLTELADQFGPYSEKQNVIIPETGAYLLDIKTVGEWSLNKE